jgi:predicted DNA-binding helix-hairpin-helix protein
MGRPAKGVQVVYPVDVNRAPRKLLLSVPGLGEKSVERIIKSRRAQALRLADVARLTRGLRWARPFILTRDWNPLIHARPAPPPPPQMGLFETDGL